MSNVQIGMQHIGLQHRPFVVAEMSGNHNQSLERALEMTEAAAKTGVQALKLQTYTADSLTLDVQSEEFMLRDENSLWKDRSLYELFRSGQTPWEWHAPIMKRAEELGMICFSSPFSEDAVAFLEGLNVPAYKIASFEITHLPLIRAAAATGKPLLISTGMASREEIGEAIATARDAGSTDVILLKCTSAYPASPKDANIRTIPDMRQHFGCEVGLSDHTMGIGVSVAAVAYGATVIEKHFTLRRSDGGVDSAFSMEPGEMNLLVRATEAAWQSLGQIRYQPTDAEKPSLKERRSLYVAADMKAGDAFTPDNLKIIRPSYGLEPRYYHRLLGRRVSRDVRRGAPVRWEMVADEA